MGGMGLDLDIEGGVVEAIHSMNVAPNGYSDVILAVDYTIKDNDIIYIPKNWVTKVNLDFVYFLQQSISNTKYIADKYSVIRYDLSHKEQKIRKKEALYKIDEYSKILDFISKNYPECAI